MDQQTLSSVEFWRELELTVTSKVGAAINKGEKIRSPLVSYLRDLEVTARAECGRRQTIQIIASGRSLLGDRSVLGPSDVPFANNVGPSSPASAAMLSAT
ncbi:hypothetical protein [Methylobacterium longum]|uniref:hypothetical protein n=1 Tax=Methylobacterium longum TaxID=767694 RepID=UPI001EE30AB4|nr:hypothetical protein [Methylobacterium longum]